MSEEIEVVLADTNAAPDQVATTAPETEVIASEVVEPAVESKTFTQEE